MFYDCSECPVALKTFCDRWAKRLDLGQPFRQGAYVYATDGRIIVRVPARSYTGPLATEGKFPKTEKMGWDKTPTEWERVPGPEPCETCHDRRVRPAYDEDGLGDPNLLVPCQDCVVICGDTRLAWHLVEPLTRFATGLEFGVMGPKDPVHFRFDGGEALVMPLRNDE